MLRPLANRIYLALFSAQIIALLGTGLLTVALGLLAFDLAGDRAGAVLGTAYAIKMIAYVGIAPLAGAIVARLPRKVVLISADLIRAGVALFLPFIDSVWQIYVLIFVLQTASATFTPAFQATIPDILKDEKDYTQALSLSRLAYDLENLLSPALAGVLLLVVSYNWLFVGTVLGFALSAAIVLMTAVPALGQPKRAQSFRERLTRGTRIYLATPRLRGLLALNMAAAAAGAFVLVNTVVIVRAGYGGSDGDVAYALAAFGGGSMLAALGLPRVLERLSERRVMIPAALSLTGLSLLIAGQMLWIGLPHWWGFIAGWAAIGLFYSAVLTPSGRLLRNSAHAEDRPAVFAAQFALSHACWLITYPLAGWLAPIWGMGGTMAALGGIALVSTLASTRLWLPEKSAEIRHSHPDLPPDHEHLKSHPAKGPTHSHVFVIDDEHRAWPTHG